MEPLLLLLLFWGVPIVLGYVFGQIAEKRHYRSIHAREQAWLHLPTTAGRHPVTDGRVTRSELVTAGTVVSADYFKRAAAALRTVIGGRVKSHESLLDRARREAVLRLKERCRGAHEIVNLRLETAPLSTTNAGGVSAVEVFAYGTALYFAHPPQHEIHAVAARAE
ncbi:YbjQ family protein [Massilia niabensis]|uniref:YbjQ family protein n=1 Tax=Massilia niabensis TaxID=544910 RepID=A0ABW0L2U7_9BURK